MAQTGVDYTLFAAAWIGPSAVPTLAELNTAWTAVQAIQAVLPNTQAKALYDDTSSDGRVLRAVVAAAVGEINTLREWIVSFQAAVAGAATLAALKTAVAALPALPDRTAAQVRTAIRNGIDAND
jgi:hypothetical protein